MTFGPDHDTGARITDLEQYKSCLDVFQKAGYDEVDTARVYVGGKQEGFTAQAGWKERGLTIATKWYPNDLGAHKPETLKAKVEESLKALETNSVDIFYLHVSRRRSGVPLIPPISSMALIYLDLFFPFVAFVHAYRPPIEVPLSKRP
jgi:aflatoxin B1 aldehyde reductase